jgi:hypothetical protein
MNYHGAVVGVFGGCHACYDGFIGHAIMIFTMPFWRWFKRLRVSTHSSIGFIYEDGYREIYEAREGKSWQGPISVERVQNWVKRSPKTRRFTMYDIPDYMVDMASALRKRKMCEDKLGVWLYSKMQLGRMGVRKHLKFIPMRPTPNNVVCSEAASIILYPQVNVLRLTGSPSFDLVNPYNFETAMKAVCMKKRSGRADVSDAYTK